MNPKEFLLQECENVRSTLRDVLRHDYAAGSSKEFYNEFNERLGFLESLLGPVDPGDTSLLFTFAGEVSLLSALVHHIERSHAGEFPWSFTEYLQKIAIPLCKEALTDHEGDPILRVYAEGGLDSYQINLENDLSVLNIGRRIFTIVFPRTLKHHVLLHAIFGHEIGHAAWTIPRHRAELRDKVLKPLRNTGPLTSISQATLWLRDPSAPTPVQDLRSQYGDDSYTEINRNQLDSWFQEFMCDLFGLVTFGPSFLAAHQTLLLALDPNGHSWGPYHPPYIARKAMLWHACKHLKWDQFVATIKDTKLAADVKRFFDTYIGSNAPGKWEDVFTAKQVEEAVDGLIAFLTGACSPCFSLPDETELSSLIAMLRDEIPPCGSDLSGSAKPENRGVDFRHILLAGWIVSEQPMPKDKVGKQYLSFLLLNKLCEMGLLQQRAIDLYHANAKESSQ
jgi:hypothetical protein